MRIDGSIPFHVARAYGLPPVNRTAQPSANLRASNQISLDRSGSPLDLARDAASTRVTPEARTRIDHVVGGRVSRPIDEMAVAYSGHGAQAPAAAEPGSRASSLPMYTRAADRIEAAVLIERGRGLDVRA